MKDSRLLFVAIIQALSPRCHPGQVAGAARSGVHRSAARASAQWTPEQVRGDVREVVIPACECRERYSALFFAAFLAALGAAFFSDFGLAAFFAAFGFTSFGAAALSSGFAAFFGAFLPNRPPPPPPLATRSAIRAMACSSVTDSGAI